MYGFDRRAGIRAIAVALLVLGAGATWAGGRRTPPLCAAARAGGPDGPAVAVLSAFPAELVPLVAAATVESTVAVDGRTYYRGRLSGVRVVLGLMGIGMVNARTTAESVLAHFDVTALLVSGVAGSTHRIGDVVVPDDWTDRDAGQTVAVNVALKGLAARAAATLAPLARCTIVPPTSPSGALVCLPFEPAVVGGGHGASGDPYGGTAVACGPGAGEVLGCELPSSATGAMALGAEASPDVEDMETAAVAQVAAARRVPFLGVRAVSDGAGDPLGDRGFPAQFFDYYRLAATNAAAVTRGTLAAVAGLATDRRGHRICRLLAAHRWERAATRITGFAP